MTSTLSRAFTLIELLVVIAIIAVLAAIAMPSFRTVEETGRSTKCAGNLRQIGVGMFLYAADHSNAFPESGAVIPWGGPADATTGQLSWMQQLGPYVSGSSDPRVTPNSTIFTCPSSSHAILSNATTADQYYSYFNGAHAAYALAGKQYAPVRRNLITHPSEQILSGDITDWYSGAGNMLDADKDDYVQCPIDLISTFHNAGINLLFYDGHVESEKWNTKLATPGYFNPARMCTIYSGPGQITYTGTAPGQ
jgi:prepilin-type N-terminal cleavage/methylation domain-containing protein/prepilin-type processing-associated H-X9-DG protein